MKRRRKNKTVVDVDMDEIRGIVDSSATGPLSEEQREQLRRKFAEIGLPEVKV